MKQITKFFLCWLLLGFFNINIFSQDISGTKVQSLDGNAWELVGFNPDKSKSVSLHGTVPGMIHPDLQREGLIPDPFWRDNFKQCQWPEHWTWTYKRTFDLPKGLLAQPWIQMQFDGIDTYSDIYVNGAKLGTTDDMFLPYQFDVKDFLKEKGNVIEIRLQTLEKMVGEKSKLKQFSGAFGDPYRAYVRRMQCTFGWDWIPRFITYGVWKSVRIVGYPNTRIDDIFVYTKKLSNNKADMSLELTTTNKSESAEKVKITMFDPENRVVWNQESNVKSNFLKVDFSIKNPQLWWSNGLGEHPLYRMEAVLFDKTGKIMNRKSIETGIRTVAIEEIKDSTGIGSSFTIILNGKRIYAKGGNWVPADPFPARISKNQYATMLKQAQEAGVNMLRVWGGGIYESQVFWDLCNRMGILASQDFMLACSEYPQDDKYFVELFKKEVTENVKRIRNNPSIVFWSGDNELGLGSSLNDNWSCRLMHQNMTAPLMLQLDPSRPFRITSPYGKDSSTNNSLLSGDSHVNSFLSEELKSKDFNFANYRDIISKYSAGRFMSEQTTGGATPKRVLKKFMNDDDLLGSEMYECHDIDNPGAAGHRTLFSYLEYISSKLYGNPNGDNDRRISQMEYTQYEFVRLGLEGNRRRKFYSSGIQFWMFNDCWPALGWSLIDYWGGRKAAWYAFAAASRPIIAASETTDKSIIWWLSNDLMKEVSVQVEIKVQPVDGKPTWIKRLSVKVPANSSYKAIELPLSEMKSMLSNNAVLVCDIKYDGGKDRSMWTAARPMDVRYEPAILKVTQNRTWDEGVVTISADKWARVVTLAGDVDFEDNYFELIPGETRSIKWKAHTSPFMDNITVSCWNEMK